ncbi:MAG: helix-turn-helix transcriptional regulator [Bacilli bacterium]|nr:helix-turn-helix transcriptional regulator [Bacilli bacterium]
MTSYNLRKVVSANVKYYRFSIGYTQEQLAEKCNLSPRYISDIENLRGNIPLDTISDIASILKVEPYLLLKEQKHKHLPKRVNMKN